MKNWQKLKENPGLWEKYFQREKILKAIRGYFEKEKFFEAETPIMVPWVILESTLAHFQTDYSDFKGQKKPMYLTTSPEASLKKLLSAGIGDCFEITKSLRNYEAGFRDHNSEFTILEWYRVGVTYERIMTDCENLVLSIFNDLKETKNSKLKVQNQNSKIKTNILIYQGREINLTPPWKRISVKDAWEKYTGGNFEEITGKGTEIYPIEKIREVSQRKGYEVKEEYNWEEIFNQIFLNEIEPKLCEDGQPFILFDYPTPLSALAKVKKEDERFAERFEFYIGGLELGDCYSELTDYEEQKKRYETEAKAIDEKGKIAEKPDTDFLEALKSGLPECSGIAVGVDRLAMLFTDAKAIEEVIFFPNSEM